MNGEKNTIKALTSLFVEGATDRIMYKVLFSKKFGFKDLKEVELEIFQNEFEFKSSLIPFEDSIVLYSKERGSMIIIKSKDGKDNLYKFAKNTAEGISSLERSIYKPVYITEFNIDINDFKIVYIFDEDVEHEKISELRELFKNHKNVFVETQPTPEKLSLMLFEAYLENLGQNHLNKNKIKELFVDCSQKIQGTLGNKNFDKKQFVLLKAIIGEQCYYAFFKELFSNVPIGLIIDALTWLNSVEIINT